MSQSELAGYTGIFKVPLSGIVGTLSPVSFANPVIGCIGCRVGSILSSRVLAKDDYGDEYQKLASMGQLDSMNLVFEEIGRGASVAKPTM